MASVIYYLVRARGGPLDTLVTGDHAHDFNFHEIPYRQSVCDPIMAIYQWCGMKVLLIHYENYTWFSFRSYCRRLSVRGSGLKCQVYIPVLTIRI